MRVRRIQLQVGLSTQGQGVSGLEIENAATQRLKIRDVHLDAVQYLVQFFGQMGADRFAGTLAVDRGDLLDLLERQSERAQCVDHLHAPQGRFVKQAVIALAAAQRVDQAHALVLAQRLDRHAGSSGELADSHRFRRQPAQFEYVEHR